MKRINFMRYFSIIIIALLISLTSCNESIYDFGFDGQLTGMVIDGNGNPVSGDVKLATYAVKALGDLDMVPMVLRIKGDGSYANTKLYPQSYEVSLEGPFIESPTDPVTIDLTGGRAVSHDFQVTPFLAIATPGIAGNPTSTSVTVNYSITPNGGNTPDLREVYVSTVSWPTRTTGNGAGYRTETIAVTDNQGAAEVSGLEPGKTYFVRVGARAEGQDLFNHSEQISFTTSAK